MPYLALPYPAEPCLNRPCLDLLSLELSDTMIANNIQELKSMVSTEKSKSPSKTGTPVMVRLQPIPLAKLDTWRRTQDDLPSRPEAIRRILEQALEASAKKK